MTTDVIHDRRAVIYRTAERTLVPRMATDTILDRQRLHAARRTVERPDRQTATDVTICDLHQLLPLGLAIRAQKDTAHGTRG